MLVSIEALSAFFKDAFPSADFEIESIGNKQAVLRQPITTQHLRPGGTVSGPTLMALADAALYTAILADLGLVAMAVTTNLNINFLNKPAKDKAIIAKCRLIKVGKTQVVGDVSLYSEGQESPVAHAVGTYALPQVQKSTSQHTAQ